MTQPVPPRSADAAPLPSDRAGLTEAPPATKCTGCECAIQSVYYELNQRPLCPACREELGEAMKGGSKSSRFLTATMSGFGAAIVGALIYCGVGLTGIRIGFSAILSGWLVGTAVFMGSDSRGGRGYHALAVVLTYLSVSASLSPELFKALKEREDFKAFHAASHSLGSSQVEPPDVVAQAFVAAVKTAGLAPVMPVAMGVDQPLSALSYGVALFVAWFRNRKAKLNIAGPFKRLETPAE
ncbi:hypothetical protein [Corallococcus sp. AS-1-6]|uniref:hypothetical protein n=1 Tax=Corallococcus sp. AS-1-6 TaxID=2874599 RepID=UPI001CBAEC5D|nr:hypothetical protein [Corallococcus sp. AS-1-6]MBZ4376015.1 hypothetical protein [Corallococcus sp. AS-1-6]